MDRKGYDAAVPSGAPDGGERRALALFLGLRRTRLRELPKQGTEAPWSLRQNRFLDTLTMIYGRVGDARDGLLAPTREPMPRRCARCRRIDLIP